MSKLIGKMRIYIKNVRVCSIGKKPDSTNHIMYQTMIDGTMHIANTSWANIMTNISLGGLMA